MKQRLTCAVAKTSLWGLRGLWFGGLLVLLLGAGFVALEATSEAWSVVREMIRLEGIEIVFGDYLQLFHSGKKSDSRATEIGAVWRAMKDCAQDFNTRVVAQAQREWDATIAEAWRALKSSLGLLPRSETEIGK